MIRGVARNLRAAAISGMVSAVLLLIGMHTEAQVAHVNGLASICVNRSTGAMRMLLKAPPIPANCSADEQFMQWAVQTPLEPRGTAGSRGFSGSDGDQAALLPVGAASAGYAARPELISYPESRSATVGSNDANSEAGPQGNQTGGFTSNGKLVPSGPPSQEQTTFAGQVTIVYAPFQVRDRATNKVLAQIVDNDGKGGRIQVFDAGGAFIAALGTSRSGTGSVGIFKSNEIVGMGFPEGAPHGTVQIYSQGSRLGELGPGSNGQMGLRIWGSAGGPEVMTVESLKDGSGGGIMIHNAIGGVAATIAPNKQGIGVFHGISIPLMP